MVVGVVDVALVVLVMPPITASADRRTKREREQEEKPAVDPQTKRPDVIWKLDLSSELSENQEISVLISTHTHSDTNDESGSDIDHDERFVSFVPFVSGGDKVLLVSAQETLQPLVCIIIVFIIVVIIIVCCCCCHFDQGQIKANRTGLFPSLGWRPRSVILHGNIVFF